MDERHNLYLHSNANLDLYPNNKQWSFKNAIPPNFELRGNGWYVGLRSISYENSWRSFNEDAMFSVVSIVPGDFGTHRATPITAEHKAKILATQGFEPDALYELPLLDDTRYFRYATTNSLGEKEHGAWVHHMSVRAGIYEHAKELISALIKSIENFYADMPSWSTTKVLEGGYDSTIDRVTLTAFEPGYELVFYEKHAMLPHMLGFVREHADHVGTGFWVYKLGDHTMAQRPPSMRSVRNLYIYTPIIEDEIVAGEYAPLLQRVAVTATYGMQDEKRFDQVDYHPLRTGLTKLEEVPIEIRDVTGEPVTFTRGAIDMHLMLARQI